MVIGANDAKYNDPLYGILPQLRDRSSLILVEPISSLHPIIRNHMAEIDYEDFEIIPSIVSSTDGEDVEIFCIKEEYWSKVARTYSKPDWPEYRAPLGVSTIHYGKLRNWFHQARQNPEDQAEDAIEKFNFKTQTIESLVNASGTQPDIIQIDIEGEDADAIIATDWNKIRPSIIYFEGNRVTKSARAVKEHLAKYGYHTLWTTNNGLAIRVNDDG